MKLVNKKIIFLIFSLATITSLYAANLTSDTSIQATVFNSPLVIYTTSRLAGAIGSLTWNGVEFINSSDHGRELQSASSFDGLGECFNPTEAGSLKDGAGAKSTSHLLGISSSFNQLKTTSLMAFWTPAGYPYPNGCGTKRNLKIAQNLTNLSNHTLSKQVTIGFSGISNVIEYLVTFRVPESHNSATFEAVTGYMPSYFSSFWTFNPATKQLLPLTHVNGEQNIPIILSSSDKKYAMGIYAPNLPQAKYPLVGYGRFDFTSQGTVKWNAVFRNGATPAGDYSYRMFVVVGSLNQVTQGMTSTYEFFNPPLAGPSSCPFNSTTIASGTTVKAYASQAVDYGQICRSEIRSCALGSLSRSYAYSACIIKPAPPLKIVPIYRLYNGLDHLLSTSKTEGINIGYHLEGQVFRMSKEVGIDLIPVYRCRYGSNHFLSLSASCEGKSQDGILGHVHKSKTANLTPLYRFVNKKGQYLETIDYNEGIKNAFTYQAVLGYVWK